jgi:hypothetical protein
MSKFLGESYDYWKSIKQPSAMGMSPGFSLNALATNVDGLLSYVEVLISGTGNASVTGRPLGNKFFLETSGKCSETTPEKWKKEREEDEKWDKEYEEVGVQERAQKITSDQATKLKNALNEEKKKRDEKRSGEKKKVSRWIYVNNIPDGSIPFISKGADGQTMDDLRGLIPGALGNLGALNPVQLFNGFTAGTYPDCAEVTLQTVNNNNVKENQRRHIALVEMVEMNPCHFPNGRNPASGKTCPPDKRIEGLTSMGSLAGSSGVAYQMSHRSPLSYNIGGSATKSSPMTGLSFDKFERKRGTGVDAGDERLDAKDIIERHNNNVGTFYSGMRPAEYTTSDNAAESNGAYGSSGGSSGPSLYDEMIEKLAQLIEPNEDNRNGDLSDIRGDTLSQVYYYSLTAILLYLLYRLLYSKK